MMDPAPIPQGADRSPSAACVDAKRLRCSETSASPVSKALDDDNTSSWPAAASLLDDEDLLVEILIHLPPQPSSLPRASLVCTRWRCILSDPEFLKRYRKHHLKPPLLGFFAGSTPIYHNFVPLLGMKPDRIPAARFAVPKSSRSYHHWKVLCCRHGLIFLIHDSERMAVVWDPLTGQQHHVPFPQALENTERDTFWVWHGAVMCADTEDGHVHGDCFSSPFRLVLIRSGHTQASACLYESVSGVWGNIISMVITDAILAVRPSVLFGNALCWLLCGGGILAFDIERQSLDVIEKPVDAHGTCCYSFQLLRTNDCNLGFASLSKLSIQLWKRKSNYDGVVEWVLLQKIIQLENLFPWVMHSDLKLVKMVGYDEESNAIVLATYIGDFVLQLESMRLRRFSKRSGVSNKIHYPYRSFYTAGRGVGWKWVDQKL